MNSRLPSSKRNVALGIGAIVVGIIGLFASLFLTLGRVVYQEKASPQQAPREIRLTNLSENSVSVSWLTEEPVLGGVIYGVNSSLSSSFVGLDDRGEDVVSSLHHVTLKNLKPEITYYFRLISGAGYFDNQGTPYVFSTPRHSSLTPAPPYVFKGKFGQEALVYFSFDDSTPISTLTNEKGNFLLSLNNALTKDQSRYYPIQKGEKGSLMIQDSTTSQTFEAVVGEETITSEMTEGLEETGEPTSLAAKLPAPEEHILLSLKMKVIQFLERIIGILTGNP